MNGNRSFCDSLMPGHPFLLEHGYKVSYCNVFHVCIIVGTMSSTSAPSIVDENYCDENIPADKATSEFKVLSPQKSILKDSNVCNILRSSPHSSETLKVVIHIQYLIVYLVCPVAHLQRGPSRFFDRIRWAVAHTPV